MNAWLVPVEDGLVGRVTPVDEARRGRRAMALRRRRAPRLGQIGHLKKGTGRCCLC